MDESRGEVKERALYDDFDYISENDREEGEGFFSPFTFLCFASVLALTGLLALLSASYDSALNEGKKFYALFLTQGEAFLIGIVLGVFVSLIPLKALKCAYFLTFPLYCGFWSLSYFTDFLSSLRGAECISFLGTITLLFAFSHIVSLIMEKKRGGVSLIILTFISLIILTSQTLLGGSGWYFLSGFVIIAALSALNVKKRYIFYIVLCLLIIFIFLSLLCPETLSSIERSLLSVSSSEYYSKDLYLSRLAIKEGGVEGVGIGNGLYKLGQIDDVEGTFIYASFFEETGIGGLMVILFSLLFIMIIALRTSDRAYRKEEYFISAFTLSAIVLFVFAYLINILYVSGFLPFGGVPLFLFSYNPIGEAMTVILLAILYKFIFRMGRERTL